jgi:hypothetical protein
VRLRLEGRPEVRRVGDLHASATANARASGASWEGTVAAAGCGREGEAMAMAMATRWRWRLHLDQQCEHVVLVRMAAIRRRPLVVHQPAREVLRCTMSTRVSVFVRFTGNAYAPLRSSRSDLRVKARNASWLRSLGRTAQHAARRAWHGAMRVLSSVRQPKPQRGPKGQSVAPADRACPTAKRKGKAECRVPERPRYTRTWRFVRA